MEASQLPAENTAALASSEMTPLVGIWVRQGGVITAYLDDVRFMRW